MMVLGQIICLAGRAVSSNSAGELRISVGSPRRDSARTAPVHNQVEIKMQRTVPILHIEDYEQAKAFYVDWLGFKIDWEFRFEPAFPVYMQVTPDGLVLHLSEHGGDNPGGVICHVDVDDLDALVAEWRGRRPGLALEVQIAPWNAKHISLKDPFGNVLGINQVLPVPNE